MSEATFLLDQHLGHYYTGFTRAAHTLPAAVSALQSTLERVPGVRATAEARLAEIDALAKSVPNLKDRCFISFVHRECLKKALSKD